MEIFCIQDFKTEFEKLSSKKSYQSIEKDVITYFFNKTSEELASGTRLNNSDKTPYIKKRLKGSGGYRFYFLLIYKSDSLYLMFVHPKTGSYGVDNLDNKSIAYLYKKVLACIKSGNLYKLELDETGNAIQFTKL